MWRPQADVKPRQASSCEAQPVPLPSSRANQDLVVAANVHDLDVAELRLDLALDGGREGRVSEVRHRDHLGRVASLLHHRVQEAAGSERWCQ